MLNRHEAGTCENPPCSQTKGIKGQTAVSTETYPQKGSGHRNVESGYQRAFDQGAYSQTGSSPVSWAFLVISIMAVRAAYTCLEVVRSHHYQLDGN